MSLVQVYSGYNSYASPILKVIDAKVKVFIVPQISITCVPRERKGNARVCRNLTCVELWKGQVKED